MLRSLLETSERERAALRRTLDDVLGFQRLAETVGASREVSSLAQALAPPLGPGVPGAAPSVSPHSESTPLPPGSAEEYSMRVICGVSVSVVAQRVLLLGGFGTLL